jgi:hypothetical protein
LVIEKATTLMTTVPDDKLQQTIMWSYKKVEKISGLIGIMNYGGVNFLGVIRAHKQVGMMGLAKINQVT